MFDLLRGAGKQGIWVTPWAGSRRHPGPSRARAISSSLVAIVPLTCVSGAPRRFSYTDAMNSDAIERLETRMAFLERANTELGDVVFRQQREIAALRMRIDVLAQRLAAAEAEETPRAPEEERPPHY